MSIFKDPFYKQAIRMFVWILVVIVATKFTKGAAGAAVVLLGIYSAMCNKPAWVLMCYALLPLMVILNPMIFAFGGIFGISVRLGMPAMALAMALTAQARRGNHVLPIFVLFFYMLSAVPSSIFGYFPSISYLKLANFFFFILGILMGTRNIDRNPRDLMQLRAFFFAFALFVICGSFAVRFLFPSAGFYSAYTWEIGHAGADALENIVAAKMQVGADLGFFCGITNHSQCLGPMVACLAGWVLCDMLFVEMRMKPLHLLMLVLAPVLLYWTKSRTSLLAAGVMLMITVFYCVPKFRISAKLKRKVRGMMIFFVVVSTLGAIGLELTSHGVSKWLLKYTYEKDKSQQLTVSDELFASRMGLIERGLYDFKKNPLLGMGFQVAEEHQVIFGGSKSKLILSAPIEKGFLPTVVLGETGIVGAIVFLAFLMTFYIRCRRRGYFVTMTLFTVYLATNLGEATFFSPGGDGGPEWIITLVGGFVIDLLTLWKKREQALKEQMLRCSSPQRFVVR